jgi:hypothetical protein
VKGEFAMSATPTEAAIVISLTDLENLLRRVVREAVREEIARLLRRPTSVLDDWRHEGPDDPEGDEELLVGALALLEQYKDDPDAWMSWEEFKAELASTEITGELSD